MRGTVLHSPYRRMIFAHLLVVGAMIAVAVGFWHRHKVDSLREQFFQRHGEIDIPEALYFDGMAVSVRVPVLLIWFGLQATAPIVFVLNRQGVGYRAGVLFWSLWLISWVGVVELTCAPLFG